METQPGILERTGNILKALWNKQQHTPYIKVQQLPDNELNYKKCWQEICLI
jgi:hypothetical protein